MKLHEYLKQSGITQIEFAAKVGSTQSYVSQISASRYVLKGKVARRWSAATNWAVTPHDFNPEDYPNPIDGIPPEHQCTAPAA
ncbi:MULTISPECIES: helix-turn-helix domain-containing protein [Yersinia]|uniref:helix-turn-helix domain-containing protein n=1 Tax=Yersinia TaxID=629 RepID=UPI0005E2EA5E|nr:MULTISPECIES: helix-turn-helix transcriptional regulator [Yersinia]MDN0106232.1 helix-turn-helix transcriptional regulator [Yersinia rochesterensis]CNK97229.1 Helix-turn-helix [Yersinia kristensenii]